MVRTPLFVLSALVASSPLVAQTAEEIVARHLQARGGPEAILAVENVAASGTLTFAAGLETPFEWHWERSGRFRLDVDFRGQQGAVGFDGQAPWTDLPFLSNPGLAFAGVSIATVQDFDGPLLAEATVELVGVEKVGSTEAFRLRVQPASGSPRELYISSEEYRLVREDRLAGDPPAVEATTVCSDFRRVGGIEVPFLCVGQRAVGRPVETVQLESVVFNQPSADALYNAPVR